MYCCEWAKVQEPFQLRGIGKQHLPFCDILSATYQGKYQCSLDTSLVTFTFEQRDSQYVNRLAQ